MKIVLATPLYPPEIAEPAPYVKELAKRLSVRHEVTVVAYTRLPEKIPGVTIIAVDKRQPLLKRLMLYFFALLHATKKANIVYAMNGASVELPVAIVTLLTRQPIIFCMSDSSAHSRTKQNWRLRLLERFAFSRARAVLKDIPLPRPEILPFQSPPVMQESAYEESWQKHLEQLAKILTHVR